MTNEELHAQMVAAMKAKDKTRLSIIRQVMASVAMFPRKTSTA